MEVILLIVGAQSEAEMAGDALQKAARFFPAARLIFCCTDAQTPPAIGLAAGEALCAHTLFPRWDVFLDHAFFFDRAAFTQLCGVLFLARAVQDGSAVLWFTPQGLPFLPQLQQQLQPRDNHVIAPLSSAARAYETIIAGAMPNRAFLLHAAPLYDAGCLYVGIGNAARRWLQWCAQKFEYLFAHGYDSFSGAAKDEMGLAVLQGDFPEHWRAYATLFGCAVDTLYMPTVAPPHCGESSAVSTDTHPKSAFSYRFDSFDDGSPIHPFLREWYGKDYRLREACSGQPFASLAAFTERSAITGDTHPVPIPAALEAIYWRRPDVQQNIPYHTAQHREAVVRWFLDYGAKELRLPAASTAVLAQRLAAYQRINAENAARSRSLGHRLLGRLRRLLGAAPSQNAGAPTLLPGVNLCGFIKGDFGLGESARIMARILEAAAIPFTVVDFQGVPTHSYSNEEFAHKITNTFPYRVSIFDTNGDGMQAFMQDVAPEILQHRYNIGYWAWELPEFPTGQWEAAFPMLHEVWTCSDFTSASIRQKSPVPVLTIPHALTVSLQAGLTRADFGLPPEPFIFLMMYDVRSVSARKNPRAVVDAFLKAFEGDDHALLLLKLNVPDDWDGEDDLLSMLRLHRNILFFEQQLPKPRLNALIGCCDAFVSLHRSEGFGLGPAEAMYLGKPAVLTNWSGNTQYMRAGACCPVSYSIVEIGQDYGPYKKGFHWAEADTADAAHWMRRLVDEPDFYRTIAQAGQAVIQTEFSPAAVGTLVRQRLEALHLL